MDRGYMFIRAFWQSARSEKENTGMEINFTIIEKILEHESAESGNFFELKKRIWPSTSIRKMHFYFDVPFVQSALKVYFSEGSTQ